MRMTHSGTPMHSLWLSLRQILSHGVVTLLAIAVAFSLPQAASYILNQWWPRVEGDANLLLATELGLASVLALLFNLAKIAWDNRQKVVTAKLASLVYARNAGTGWLSRRRERALVKRLPAPRDAFILSVTGHDTFVDPSSLGREALEKAYEEEPFWKLIVLGDYVWVQHCHSGFEVRQQPEYVFALQHGEPRHGLFVPFYMVFLNQWNDARHPEYDFDTNELVYRDASGKETGRAVLGVPINGATVPLPSSRAPGAGAESRAALLRRPDLERTAAL